MSNYSPKVTQFLKDNPDFEKVAKEAYSAAKNFKTDDFKSIKPETKTQIEKKFGTTIDASKLSSFSNVAKKLNEQEFVSWIAGDNENFPAVQLNQAEMAMVKGGSWFGTLLSSFSTDDPYNAGTGSAGKSAGEKCAALSKRW